MAKVHTVKSHPVWFNAIWYGAKTAELRRDDRGYEVGDTLAQHEWKPETQTYTGRVIIAPITHIVRDTEHLSPGYAMLSLGDIARIE
ncbi:MAG: DUF3850 domain-containing protein [Chloroflexales bacterium]